MAELLARYWTLALPTAVASLAFVVIVFVGLISAIVAVVFGHEAAGHVGTGLGLGGGVMIWATLLALGLLGMYVAQALTIAAAPDAFAGREPNLAAALNVTIARLPQLVVAAVASFALALVPIALSLVLVGIPLLIALGYFLMFVPAAVIVGNESGLEAVATSFRLTTRRVGECFVAWLGIVVALVAGVVANGIAVHVPLVNLVAGFAIGGFTSAYAALVTVRFYLALRDGDPVPQQPVRHGGPPSVIR